MLLRPICEPIDLPAGRIARIEFVETESAGPAAPRFLHFHDAVELVLFGNARGRFLCDGAHFAVEPGSIFYAPTMRYHDYAADDGPADWVLIQLDPYAVQRIAGRLGLAAPTDARCVRPGGATNDRLLSLSRWLAESLRADGNAALAEQIVALMLTAVWTIPGTSGEAASGATTDIERFTPVIDRLHARPGEPFDLAEAATLTSLSPAYFSRRFSEVFGCGFAEYVMAYRLHLAAQHVASTTMPFASIAYALGFASPSHFSARYRERFGMSPKQYRLVMRR